MPIPIPAGLKVGLVEPKAAIAAFQARRLLAPSYAWQDVFQDEHSRGYAVAGVQRLDILQIFFDESEAAVNNGGSLKDFRDSILPKLTAKGWWGDIEVKDAATGETRITRFDDRRLKLIYDTNVRQAYAAGRWAETQKTKARLPFLVYFTMQDEHVRASHRRWNALVLPVDHPFWDTHYPPNGWNCRCYAYAIDQKGIDRLRKAGVKIQTEAPAIDWVTYVNPRTGEVVPVPRGIDPGFAYNPGKARDEALYEASLRKALGSSPLASATALAQAQADMPAFVASATRRFGKFVDQLVDAKGKPIGQARGDIRYIGTLAPQAVRALQIQNIELASPVVAVRDEDVLHTFRDAKDIGAKVAISVYRRLPELLQRAHAVLLDSSTTPPALLYVVDLVAEDGTVAKLVISLEYRVRMRLEDVKTSVPLNLVRTVTVIDPNALQDRSRYQLIWGRV